MKRRNLLNFLLITGLFMLCPCIVCGLPLNQLSGNGSSFTQKNNPDSSQEAQRAEFMRKYGITEQQAMRIQQFSWERSCKIRELNQQNLSTKELLKKRKALTKIYYQKIA